MAERPIAKPERQACGKFFFDCLEPSDTVYEGVICRTCGVIVTAEYFEQAYEPGLANRAPADAGLAEVPNG